MLWTFVAMAVILVLALTIGWLVAYPHRGEFSARWLDDRRV